MYPLRHTRHVGVTVPHVGIPSLTRARVRTRVNARARNARVRAYGRM